ncbi:MAG: chromosome segregation protein SMC [Thermoanaerobaculia bacterium]
MRTAFFLMFKLDRLELSGFKSFVDPDHLVFSGGITGIVGPNGCGKSNVCDAVCWVLGERSAKILRGETMEDVIFGGSASRKPLGMAEVQLTLTTESSFEHADDGRLTIGRRVHRSGESQYTLNGKTVRLKDIRSLLMDTGLGIRAYSVIEQGKIGMILSGKPQERRKLLEEAAGITRYKERRRVAEVKLEAARGNLARLDDILSEIGRNLRSLKRQAGAARRFKKRKQAYQELLGTVLLGRWSRLHQELAESGSRLASEQDAERATSAQLQGLEAKLLSERQLLDRKASELAEHHQLEADLAARIEGKQEFIRGSRARLEEIGERTTQGSADARNRRERLTELRAALREVEQQVRALERDRSSAATEVNEDDAKIGEVERAASESESRMEGLRNRLLQSIGNLNRLRTQLHEAHVEREKNDLRNRHVADELGQKVANLQETSAQLDESEAVHERLAKDVRAETARLEQSNEAVRQGRASVERLREVREEAREELRSLEQTRELLEELGKAQEVRRANLREVFARAGLGEPRFLTDHISVPEGWERSVDLYLGTLADAILVSETSGAAVALNAIANSRLTAELLTTDVKVTGALEIDDPAVGASLAEALDLPPELAAGLPPAYLVESPDDARRLAAAHAGVAFITKDRLWAQSGLLRIQGRDARPGTLTREHDLGEIANRIGELAALVAEHERDLAAVGAELATSEETKAQASECLAELRREFAVVDARRDDLLSQHRRLSVEHETLHAESAEIGRALGLVADRTDELAAELERTEALHQQLETDFDQAQRDADKTRSERELMRATGASRRGSLELLDQRLESLGLDVERNQRDISETERAITTWQAEDARLVERKTELESGVGNAESDLQDSLEKRERAQEDVIGRQEALNQTRAALAKIEDEIEACRERREQLRDRINEIKVREAAVDQDREHLATRYREAFSRDLPETPEPAADDLDELEVGLAQLKDRLDRTGPVNLLAAEEFEELEQRNEFLAAQRTDVADSVHSLKQTIRGINRTSSERFLETFMKVNEFFGQAFRDLFRGGQAEMRLLDEDDPLECALEIVARPPGKRLQNIMLMSGGEKALTAIALLFALFRTKPSPFCILDEVDAPLDDINTLRFVQLLQKMTADTQFVVITHNKLTMEATTRLYGVTMQERGVSRLVSVELDDIHPDQRATA